MTPLFGPSRRDRDQLIHALRPLGVTTVPKLGATLGWSPRKTSRVIRTLFAEEFPGFHYDPIRRIVQLSPPEPLSTHVPGAISGSATPDSPPGTAPEGARPWGPAALCPSCRVSMTSTGTGSTLFCPQCGRLSSLSSRSQSTAPPPVAPVPSASGPGGLPHVADRRTQELFAAWVTAQPIACPKCRTPLQHRGVGQYACPACGHQVSFPVSPSVPAPIGVPERGPNPAVAMVPSQGSSR